MVFYAALAQAEVLASAKPAQWLEWPARRHRASCTWSLIAKESTTAEHLLSAVLEAAAPRTLSELYIMTSKSPGSASPAGSRRDGPQTPPGRFTLLRRDSAKEATLLRYTPVLQFLDCIKLTVRAEGSILQVQATSQSCCCMPAWVPLGVVPGALLCWVPFPDWGTNLQHLQELGRTVREALGVDFAEERIVERGSGSSLLRYSPARMVPALPPSFLFFAAYIIPLATAVLLLLCRDSNS